MPPVPEQGSNFHRNTHSAPTNPGKQDAFDYIASLGTIWTRSTLDADLTADKPNMYVSALDPPRPAPIHLTPASMRLYLICSTEFTNENPMETKQLDTITLNEMTILGLGERIRVLRKKQGKTLEELANRIGVSKSLISQIESGKANPSLNTLWNLADALGIHVTTLFKREEGSKPIVEPARIRDLSKKTKCYVLSPRAVTDFEFAYVEYLPGGSSGEVSARHSGTEYFLVIEGKIEVLVGNENFLLKKNESITFSGRVQHSMKNIGRKRARALFLIMPND